MIAFLTATLPCFGLEWKTGVERLRIVSVGTGYSRVKLAKEKAVNIHLLDAALHVIPALMNGAVLEQDLLCRVLGKCDFGEEIDMEIKSLIAEAEGLGPIESRKFRYIRYDHRFLPEEEAIMSATRKNDPLGLDNLLLIPVLAEIGREYAESNVHAVHLGLPE